jgi:hypothetical protein
MLFRVGKDVALSQGGNYIRVPKILCGFNVDAIYPGSSALDLGCLRCGGLRRRGGGETLCGPRKN